MRREELLSKRFDGRARLLYRSQSRIHGSDVLVLFVGNKCDLAHQVSIDSAQELAKRHNSQFFTTSALTGERISDVVQTLA
jgi:Ni2+-binding GTPase involved in maturation of urease and hydrogenase